MAIAKSTVSVYRSRDAKDLLSVDTSDNENPVTLRIARPSIEQLEDLAEAITEVVPTLRVDKGESRTPAPKGRTS